jgi:peptidoglycan/xylan/chitin deacetylase (PgdA/CDA1 family)
MEREQQNNKEGLEMGKWISGWFKGAVLFILAGTIVTAGLSVNHYLLVKAATTQNISHAKSGPVSVKQAETLRNTIRGSQLEKEWMEKVQNEAIAANMQKIDKENANVPDKETPKNDTVVTNPPVNKPAPQPPAKPVLQTPDKQPPAKPIPKPPAQPAQSGKRTIYLTFDDGPEVFSKDIIALLEKYHYKATFFMLEPNVKAHPDAVKLMVQMHEGIGLHGVTHNKNLFYASAASVVGEMDQDRNTIKSITGIETYLIRTPYGSAPYMKPEYKQAVADHGYSLWDWNIDSRDWDFKDERYVTSVIQQLNERLRHPGPIVILLHERRETLAHLPKLLDYLSKNGFESKAIDQSIPAVHF